MLNCLHFTITNGKEKWRQDQHTNLLYPPAKVTDSILKTPIPVTAVVWQAEIRKLRLSVLRVITVISAMTNSENCFNYYFIKHKLCKEANALDLQTCFIHQANKQRFSIIHVTQNKLCELLYQASTLKNTSLILTVAILLCKISYTLAANLACRF